MPPEAKEDRRTSGATDVRRRLAGLKPSDERATSQGRRRILEERRSRKEPPDGWRRWGWVYVLLAVAGLLLLVIWLVRTQVPESFPVAAEGDDSRQRFALVAEALTFASRDGRRLETETQLLPRLPTTEERIRAVITALIEGSTTGLLNPWPREAALLDLFLAADGTAYLNMSSAVRAGLGPGDTMEWLLVASVTCTLGDNFPDVRGVRLMVDGESRGFLRRFMPLEWTYTPAMFSEVR